MTNAKFDILKALLVSNNGIIKTEAFAEHGFSSRNIQRLLQEGVIERVKHGHYIEKQREVSDIEVAAKLVPMGVFCLFTAIEYHELATVNPAEICVALPREVSCPTLPSNLFVKVYRMTSSHFEAGISKVKIGNETVRMYDAEKTVCDCYKYDKEIERNIALEVLKNYMAKGNCNIQKLLEYAKLLGKKKIIYPYVEALI